jgi:hypothetical protein
MTLAEVEGIFSGPAGDYSTQPELQRLFAQLHEACGAREKLWGSDHGIAIVYFDANSVSQIVFISSSDLRGPSILDKVRAWMRWHE